MKESLVREIAMSVIGTWRKRMIHARHENGYSGALYGASSMSIYRPDGSECLHTGKRSVNTEEELMELLEGMPEFFESIKKVFESIKEEEDDEKREG